MTLTIDVTFDLICPWCLIGKRHLETALAELAREEPQADVRVRWLGVQLMPQVPAEGWPFREFYERRLGGPDAMHIRQLQVQRVALAAGAEICFEQIETFSNTARAHALLDFARAFAPALHETLLDRLFRMYFVDGIDIGDAEALLQVAQQCGIDTTTIAPELRAPELPARAHAGATVPLFSFDRLFLLSGAQSPEMLLAAMRQALAANLASAAS